MRAHQAPVYSTPPTLPGQRTQLSASAGDDLPAENHPAAASTPRVTGLEEAETNVPGGKRTHSELCRKTLHMLPGFLPFVLAAVPHPDPLDTVSLGVVTTICVVLTTVFLLLHRLVRRPGEHNFLSTTLSYPGTILLTLLLFPGHAEFAGVVVTVLALGDGSAYLVGKRFGKQRLPWNSEKSWLGSIAFVVVSAPIATLAYWLEAANPAVPLAMAAVCGLSAALAGAIAESLPSKITDNLRVGVAASLAVIAAHFSVAGWFVS